MERPSDVRAKRYARAIAVAIAFCGLSSAPVLAQGAPVGRSFGDSTAYGVHILSIKPDSEVATFTAQNGKHIIVLEIIPGNSVDILLPGGVAPKRLKDTNTYALALYRFTAATNSVADEAAQRSAEAAYQRCVASADAAARRAAAAKRTRDASGKETGPSKSEVMSTTSDAEMSGRMCGRSAVGTSPNKPMRTVRLAPRAPADRYLVVLSSSANMSLTEVTERLSQLTTVGSDVATTVEALAAGLFLGKAEKWGGAFIPW